VYNAPALFVVSVGPACIPIQLNWWLVVMPKGVQAQRVEGAWGARARAAVFPIAAVETRGLTKDYTVRFLGRGRRRALDHLNLRVEQGETFGVLGPNGAGKSTTLKLLLGLIRPTQGHGVILGHGLGAVSVRARIGYLPENPYFYDHLTAKEFLNYVATLFCLSPSQRRARVAGLLDRVGLSDSQNLPVRKLSKGMVQRLGIAQALVNDPEVIILDEPMSGLDPLGRREVRDLILQLRHEGKTILLSTHILSDAEAVCDRVGILNRGRLQGCGELRKILGLRAESTEIVLEDPGPEVLEKLEPYVASIVRTGERVRLEVRAESDLSTTLDRALRLRTRIVSVNPVKVSLEDYFMTQVGNRNWKLETGNWKLETGNSKPETGSSSKRAEGSQVESPDGKAETHRAQAQDIGPQPAAAQETSGSPVSSFQFPVSKFQVPISSFQFPISNFQSQVRNSARRIGAIALHNFKESVRDRVLYNLVLFALLLISAAILFSSISVGIERTILVNLGLSSISIFGLLISIFIGIGLVAKEIERRTIYSILSKPVWRAEFILGKYFGLLLTLAVNTAIMTAGFYLALIYQDHRLERADLAPLEAIYFILLQLALVVALALLFSSISTPILSAVFTFCFFFAGHFLADLRTLGHESGSAMLKTILNVLYYLLPDFGAFSVIGQAAHGNRMPGYLVVGNSLYALLYATILISAAVLVFEEREFR
jgi:ABC-2 type transport system ATP-binding protein